MSAKLYVSSVLDWDGVVTLVAPSSAERKHLTLSRLLMMGALLLLALSTRMSPYAISSYPFNNDGITEARIAADIVSAGHLEYPADSFYYGSYSVITPIYNILVAFSSSFLQTDTFDISQTLVAVFSILTVVMGYVIALRISNSLVGGLSAGMVLSLLGTFVFLSGSAWKVSLGIAVLLLMVFAYMNRLDKRFLMLELLTLAVLPLIHHLVALLALLMLAYLTCWSVSIALARRNVSRNHLVDLIVFGGASLAAYLYYRESSFQRLSEFSTPDIVAILSLVFLGLLSLSSYVLTRRRWTRISFAPIAGFTAAFLLLLDYSDPIFPYTQGFGFNMLVIGFMYCLVLALGWFGIGRIVRSYSRYRAIPLGLLLPILTLILLAVISGFDLQSHKILYRVFDFADISLALGVAAAVASLPKRRSRAMVVAALLCVLVLTFPFAYLSGPLVGIRHDTQQYEVDAIFWVSTHADASSALRSDERIAYDAQALCDFGKDPSLPSLLSSGDVSKPSVFNLLLEEWMSIGVNDYPRGHTTLDEEQVSLILMQSDVLWVGGPESNNLIVFKTSSRFY